MQPALVGGLFIGVLAALPVIGACNCCCLWSASGGALAAWLQHQEGGRRGLTPGAGARVGLFAGVIGAVVWLIVAQLLAPLVGPIQESMMGEVMRNAGDLPPESRAMLDAMMEGNGVAGRLFNFGVLLVVGSLVSSLGGLVAAAYFRPNLPPALGGPIEQEPPPNP